MPFDSKTTGPSSMPASGSGTIGYYRFTDIFFEWHQALPKQEDVGPLKALIAYSALVHPDHPLRKPGVNGIELYLGTFESNEMRLLFSSAQIEYMRYWLHACGLTRDPIPIPSSEYLIKPGDLRNCSPDVYSDAAVLKRAIKVRRRRSRPRNRRSRGRRRGRRGGLDDHPLLAYMLCVCVCAGECNCADCTAGGAQNIEKNNKRLKGTGTLLGARRQVFERVRTLWAAKLGTWLAMDFEAWDREHTLLKEFGWSLVQWTGDEQKKEHGHLVVIERRHFSQTYVPNHQDNYNFGKSIDVDKDKFKEHICELIEKHRKAGPLFIVFHDASQDVKYLKSDGLKAIERIEHVLPDNPATGEIYVVDTVDLFAALEGDSSNQSRALDRVCRHLQIPTSYLHNAGNDAYYTLEAMMSMASGDPLDEQREKRWPNRTVDSKPKVEFADWEEDSDLSDMEGIFGFPPNSTAKVAKEEAIINDEV
ncbi:hypothetical protein DICSQDRAFT_136768 [Dichomitus squalens LYAD-421 SS1]|uniref:Gfd2/YDR514C-like C-terminal domain-containing protein n=1 Tax=Dichomitus squalens (strain LYAD-421) TaxID=732165 RepID=R7SZS9_DICSQ|nr:uncharacterized protein DICSQDRAFT_136768 [Dichomitus squalens LYAD-421 SS1]EJF61210.1 hypothetical protein DICSQDRAFT_136768 [Dichomitus squalens LYAD-421 SS1]